MFQSPPKEKPKLRIKPEVASRVEKSKRVLFSPHPPSASKRDSSIYSSDESQQSQSSAVRSGDIGNFQLPSKRKREDDPNCSTMAGNISKMPRTVSCLMDNLAQRTVKLSKSHSFGHAIPTTQQLEFATNDKSIFRATSETAIGTNQLSQVHRQVSYFILFILFLPTVRF